MMLDAGLLPVWPHVAIPLTWALVGAALVCWIWPRAHFGVGRACVAATVAVVAVWPQGGWSGYAALALQSPSVLSLTWALALLLQSPGGFAVTRNAHRPAAVPVLAWYLLCLLGWTLVVDTLNLWPSDWQLSAYAWGFSAGSLWLSAGLVMALAWRSCGPWVWQAIAVLALYAVLRWPSGNVWDAWLDPVVWVVAHVRVVRHGWRQFRPSPFA